MGRSYKIDEKLYELFQFFYTFAPLINIIVVMNLRVLKKDIDFLVNDFVSDCLLFSDFNEGAKDESVKDLVCEALALANALTDRLNKPFKTIQNEKGFDKVVRLDKKETKAHYKAINQDLYAGFDKMFEKLSELAKQK